MLPALALQALDPDETATTVYHLQQCPGCRAEAARYHDLADLLGSLAPDRDPSPGLRRRVLRSFETDRSTLGRFSRGWPAAVAAVLVLGLVSAVAVLWLELRDTRAAIEREAEWREQAISASMVWYDVAAMRPSDTAIRGSLCATEAGEIAWLIVEGMPSLPSGMVYQVWLNQSAERINAGTFTVDGQGRGFLAIVPRQSLAAFDTMGVTMEPDGGSPQPTGERYLRVELAPAVRRDADAVLVSPLPMVDTGVPVPSA